MNERIQELCKRAGFIGEGFQNTVIGTCQETALENLAELIVRECVDWCNVHATVDGTAQKIAESIKKDFGVD
jgi:hypothetical protein